MLGVGLGRGVVRHSHVTSMVCLCEEAAILDESVYY